MPQLFFMKKFQNKRLFLAEIKVLSQQKNAKLFYTYVQDNFFVVSTAKRVLKFDFSDEDEEFICRCIDDAIKILRKNLTEQILLFNEGAIVQKKNKITAQS